eukprot:1509952-Pyramimonas_sp.AAC.1
MVAQRDHATHAQDEHMLTTEHHLNSHMPAHIAHIMGQGAFTCVTQVCASSLSRAQSTARQGLSAPFPRSMARRAPSLHA